MNKVPNGKYIRYKQDFDGEDIKSTEIGSCTIKNGVVVELTGHVGVTKDMDSFEVFSIMHSANRNGYSRFDKVE
jgi:hypothetical protein